MDIEKLFNIVVDSCFKVHMALPPGYLETVYHNALMVELTHRGISFEKEVPVKVFYRGECVGDYRADLIIEKLLIVEIKAVETLHKRHEAQVVNYLNATGINDGLLVNFGTRLIQFKRKYRYYTPQK